MESTTRYGGRRTCQFAIEGDGPGPLWISAAIRRGGITTTIFATPDFGASGIAALFLLITWAIVLVLVLIGIILGIRLLRSESPKRRRFAILLLTVSGLVPFFCCLGPSHVVRLVYGNYPLSSYPDGKIKEGMTKDEVEGILGTPHQRIHRGDEESWYYWLDSFGIGYFGVQFGPDGRVQWTHGN